MAQVKILMHDLGDEQYVVDTLYVRGYDNGKEIEATMTEVGMPPSGWSAGRYYSAVIDENIDSKDAMTMDEFRKRITHN